MLEQPGQQQQVAMQALSGCHRGAADALEVFAEHAPFRKRDAAGLVRVPPLRAGQSAVTVGQAKAWGFETNRLHLRGLFAVAGADKQELRCFVKAPDQAHLCKQNSVAVDVAALWRKLLESTEAHHTKDLVAHVVVEQQILETDDGVRRLGPERPFVALDKLSMLVDDPGQGVGNDQGVVGFQSIHTETQEVGLNHVIMGGPFEVFAGGLEVNISQVPSCAHVAVCTVVANAIILRGIFPADLPATIGGAIVGDDELKILECLVQDGLDGGSQETIPVVEKEPDAEKWVITHAYLLRSGCCGGAGERCDDDRWGEVARMTVTTFFSNERSVVLASFGGST